MKDKNFKNIIESMKKISLSPNEKSALFDVLDWYADANPSVKSPYSFSAWKTYIHRPISYVVAGVVFMVIGGSGVVYASQDALPGDMLYGVKTNISEPIAEVLAVTKEAKQRLKIARVQERLNEVEVLAVKDTLASSTSSDLKEVIHREIDNAKDSLSDKNKKDLDIALSAHNNVLESIKKHVSDDVKVRITDIQSVVGGDDEVNVEVIPAKKINKDEDFPQKKDKVQKAIKDVNQKIKNNAKSEGSLIEKDIIENVSGSIQNAENNLKQAEDNYMKDEKDAAQVLIDVSEKATKEANISIDRGLELGKLKGNKKEDK